MVKQKLKWPKVAGLGKEHPVWEAFGLRPVRGRLSSANACPLARSVELKLGKMAREVEIEIGIEGFGPIAALDVIDGRCPDCGVMWTDNKKAHKRNCGIVHLAMLAADFIGKFDGGQYPDLAKSKKQMRNHLIEEGIMVDPKDIG